MRRPLLALACLIATPAGADVIDVRQGTNIAVAADPTGQTLVVDLLGGLWRLPVSGGGATMLSAPGSGIAQPRFADDGSRVVVERNRDGQWDLWMLDLVSGSWEQLTDSPFAERHPDFLPGGTGVVFTSDRSGREQLWILDLTSRALRQLTDEPGDSRFPSVSATGGIAYVNATDATSTLRLLRGSPVGISLTTSRSVIEAPSWRPDSTGRVLVYNRHDGRSSDLGLLIDADIRIERPLTRDEDVFVGRPAWLGPDEFIYAADGQLWRRRVASTERRPVHMFAGVDVERPASSGMRLPLGIDEPRPAAGIRDLTVSADGRATVFAALGDLWLLRGRSLERLTNDPDVDVEPAFIGDTGEIAFLSDRTGTFDVWRLDPDSGERRQVTSTTGHARSLVLSVDGTRAYFLSTDAGAAEGSSQLLRSTMEPGATVAVVAGPFTGPVELTVDAGGLLVQGPSVDAHVAVSVQDGERNVGARRAAQSLPDLDAFEALAWTRPAAEPVVLQIGRLFDGIGNDYKRHVDVHISDGRIIDIVARGRRASDGPVLDFAEATLLPGFVDVHAHHPRNDPTLLGLEWLRHGVTTVREVTEWPSAALERAESWASGRRAGPRLVVHPAGTAPTLAASTLLETAPGSVSSGFVHARARFVSEGNGAAPRAVAAPAPGFDIALSPLGNTYQDTLAVIGGAGGYLSTGLTAALSGIGQGDSRRLVARQLASIVERAQRSFGRIAIGSDAPLVPYGLGFIDEIETLVRNDIPPAQVLRWATAGGAMALGVDADLGTIEPGKLADLIVVEGDPLNRIDDVRRVALVMVGGTIVWQPR